MRQAIAHAVNWGALIEPFYGEYGQLAGSFQPPAIFGSNPDVLPYEYNPEKAKELLAAAGLPDGFETDFWYIPVIRGYFPDSKAIGEAIAADLAKVGIRSQPADRGLGRLSGRPQRRQVPHVDVGLGL